MDRVLKYNVNNLPQPGEVKEGSGEEICLKDSCKLGW